MIDKVDTFEFYISEWDRYTQHLKEVNRVIDKFPGDKKLVIKSYEAESTLCYVFKNVDTHHPELEKKLIEWRTKYNYKVIQIGLNDKKTDTASLKALKKLFDKYFGQDKIHLDLIKKNMLLELKDIRIDSSNPNFYEDLFTFMDVKEEEAPF